MIEDQFTKEISTLKPWNSLEDPIKVNTIRYNHDYTLLTLGTSKGYRIFLTSNLKMCNQESEINNNFGDIMIAMVYYNSSLVFLLPSASNEKYSNKELIIFDDFYQRTLASFKDKNEEIINFFLSKNVLFIITINRIIVIELFSFKIIETIEKTNFNKKLLSFNFYDNISYTYSNDKTNIYIKQYLNVNYKIQRTKQKIIAPSFGFFQIIQLSPMSDLIAVVSIFGNKIHIYNTETGNLKECIYVGPTIQTMEKVEFSEKKSNYIFLLKNNYFFHVYKLKKCKKGEIGKCICDKYDDNKILNEEIRQPEAKGFMGFMRKSSKNKDIKEAHAFSEYEGRLLFIDFDRNKHKDLIMIKYNGEFIKYHFNKKKSGKISPLLSINWI
jgi:hypothetical protein